MSYFDCSADGQPRLWRAEDQEPANCPTSDFDNYFLALRCQVAEDCPVCAKTWKGEKGLGGVEPKSQGSIDDIQWFPVEVQVKVKVESR